MSAPVKLEVVTVPAASIGLIWQAMNEARHGQRQLEKELLSADVLYGDRPLDPRQTYGSLLRMSAALTDIRQQVKTAEYFATERAKAEARNEDLWGKPLLRAAVGVKERAIEAAYKATVRLMYRLQDIRRPGREMPRPEGAG